MSTVQPTDKTLVNRAGVDHSAPADMSTVQDTDLLLINRAGVDYKCTFLDWKNSQSKAPDVGTVTLADVAGGSRFTSVAFPVSATMTENGIPASAKKLKAYVEGTLKSAAQTSAITKVEPNVAGVVYSAYLDNEGHVPFETGREPPKAFDGDTTTFAGAGLGGRLTLIVPGDLSGHVEVMTQFAVAYTITIESADGSVKTATGQGETWIDLGTVIDIKRILIDKNGQPNPYLKAVRLNGKILVDSALSTRLTFADSTSLSSLHVGESVTEVGNGDNGKGTIAKVDATANTLTLVGQESNWDVGSKVQGRQIPAANVKLYCKLDAAGAVSDLQSADPGFTAWTPAGTGPYTGTVTWPATLPSGNAPDADLPAGTTITVEVQATNTAGTDSAKSNVLTPA